MVRPSLLVMLGLAAGLSAAGGCDDGKERHARADLERARARISAQMDKIARESAEPTEVVIESVGERPDDVVAVLVAERGVTPEDARAMILGPREAGQPAARSSAMARADAEVLRDRLQEAGAVVRLEAGPGVTGADSAASEAPTHRTTDGEAAGSP